MTGEIVATVAAGIVIVAMFAAVGVRGSGAVRYASVLTGFCYAVWTAASVGLLLGLSDTVFWAVIRPLILLIIVSASNGTPGVTRTGREWLEVLLDGLMAVGGLFGLFWMVAITQTVIPERAGTNPLMFWLVLQILLMSLVAGLFARAAPGYRGPTFISLLVGILVLAGDVLALVTGKSAAGIGFWLGGALLMGVTLLLFGSEMYADSFYDPEKPLRIRVWQLPIGYAAAYLFLPVDHDGVLNLTMALVVGALLAELVMHSRRNERLWTSLGDRTRVYQDVLQESQDVILQIDTDGIVEFANPAAARVLSIAPSALVGSLLRNHLHPDDRQSGMNALRSVDWQMQPSIRIEARFGAPIPGTDDGDGPPLVDWRSIEWTVSPRSGRTGMVLAGRDISARITLERELVTAARTDGLTRLLNRAAFLSVVDARLADNGGAAVLFIDLDGFKAVNDTLGHAQGDKLLVRAAMCLQQAVGPFDVVARLGGDEFAVLPQLRELSEARLVADAVVTAFNGFDETAHGRPSVSASVGIVIVEAGPRTGGATELLRDADLAMYRAKQRGGAGAVEFEPWMSERVLERSRLRADLETAVANEALALYLQPVIDLHTRQWAGFEALVRWPVGTETWSPAQFLPVAEESGLIVPMGAWVLSESLRQLAGWQDDSLGMAVNVSAQQLIGTDFFDVTMAALEASGVAPNRLTLEITEQAAIQDLGRTASRLESLRSEGVHVAIDDFGTGFSSLQYLSRLPVDILKIDRKFVWGLGQHAEDDVLVRSMLGLAAELGLEVIAEGVETRRQAELLLEYGCRLAQGFLFSPPRPIEELRSSDPFVSPAPGVVPGAGPGVVPGLPRPRSETPLPVASPPVRPVGS
jgi:diguanylate cyclase (GGDEF)-like protein/PAS domain S-box-containing protein